MSENTVTVGYVTDRNEVVCLGCADYCGSGNAGRIADTIQDPAPRGIFHADAKNREHYDAPCALCGWPIRRSR